MDHDEVREQLELAATEPAGIDRLMAGDTPLAAAIAAHLAGCSPCTDELDRLRRAAIIIGDAVRTTPPPELRERTLAFVRDVGRIREAPAPVASVAAAMPIAVSAATAPSGFGRGLAWVGAIAAAVLIAVTATAFVLDRQSGDRLAVAQAANRRGWPMSPQPPSPCPASPTPSTSSSQEPMTAGAASSIRPTRASWR